MNFDWEYVCSRHWTVFNATEEEKAVYNELRSRDTFSREEVKKILDEYCKYLSTRFDGPVTLLNSQIIKTRILNSQEYRLNLFPETGK